MDILSELQGRSVFSSLSRSTLARLRPSEMIEMLRYEFIRRRVYELTGGVKSIQLYMAVSSPTNV